MQLTSHTYQCRPEQARVAELAGQSARETPIAGPQSLPQKGKPALQAT